MDLSEYQQLAARTDQQTGDDEQRMLVALLGLAGEVGTLLSEHKKWLRDGDAHVRLTGVVEDIGDILWYLAAAATALKLDLSDVARANLAKTVDRWPTSDALSGDPLRVPLPPARVFDEAFPEGQRLPRRLTVALAPLPTDASRVIGLVDGGRPLGNLVGDNAYDDDGYRWHDAIHLAHATVLGWSPVVRAILGRKRRDDPSMDDIEDGGRAIAIEEGIAAAVFEYASMHQWLDGIRTVDSALLAGLRNLTKGLEVRVATLLEWEQAILRGFDCWRQLRKHEGGLLILDLDDRSIEHRPLTNEERADHAVQADMALSHGLR